MTLQWGKYDRHQLKIGQRGKGGNIIRLIVRVHLLFMCMCMLSV